MNARLARIRIFPVKSLDPVELDSVAVHGGAGLRRDREWRFVDEAGRVANGKRLGAAIMGVRSRFDLVSSRLTLEIDGEAVEGSLEDDRSSHERRLSEHLGEVIRFERDSDRGFPDDTEASGPTLISRATLVEVAAWFGLDEEEVARRFRANLEVDGVPAFWEDRLCGAEGEPRFFQVGEVRLEAVNPCARCAVPSRDSYSGEIARPDFAKAFAEMRREALPQWAEPSRFDHFYRLAVNTRVPASEDGKAISVGDVCVQAEAA